MASGSMVMPALPTTVMIPFSDATKIVLGRAAEAATRLGHREINTGHLILALMQSAPSMAASILTQRRVSERSLLGDGDAFLTDG